MVAGSQRPALRGGGGAGAPPDREGDPGTVEQQGRQGRDPGVRVAGRSGSASASIAWMVWGEPSPSPARRWGLVMRMGVIVGSQPVNCASERVRGCPRLVVQTGSPRLVCSRVTVNATGSPPREGRAPVVAAVFTSSTRASARRAPAGTWSAVQRSRSARASIAAMTASPSRRGRVPDRITVSPSRANDRSRDVYASASSRVGASSAGAAPSGAEGADPWHEVAHRAATGSPADVGPHRDTADVITAGVDLAAEARGTAVAVITWDPARARVTSLIEGAHDADVLAAAHEVDRVGVDCPFGWPMEFVRLVHDHERGQLAAPPSSGRDWRRGLTMRLTDQHVHRVTGLTPLSVAADRIGHAALRWAAIAATLEGEGLDVSRDGSGVLAEVYPSAALHHWQLPYRGYKGTANRSVREGLVDRLLAQVPWLDLGEHAEACRTSDHALDAVLCALVARAVALRATTAAGADQSTAAVEGWIHVPTVPLEVLIRSP